MAGDLRYEYVPSGSDPIARGGLEVNESSISAMRRHGLTNHEVGDLTVGRQVPETTQFVAFCSSPKCAGLEPPIHDVQKYVPYSAIYCPDCAYALKWVKVRIGSHLSVKVNIG